MASRLTDKELNHTSYWYMSTESPTEALRSILLTQPWIHLMRNLDGSHPVWLFPCSLQIPWGSTTGRKSFSRGKHLNILKKLQKHWIGRMIWGGGIPAPHRNPLFGAKKLNAVRCCLRITQMRLHLLGKCFILFHRIMQESLLLFYNKATCQITKQSKHFWSV